LKDRARPLETWPMTTLIYRCPTMRLKVQGWFAEDASGNDGDTYEPVTCTACRRVHLVNRKTGRTLGSNEE